MAAHLFRDWIVEHLDTAHLSVAFLFGSAVHGTHAPNDCDLFLVTGLDPSHSDWAYLRAHLAVLRDQFQQSFGLPLAIELLTEPEYSEWLTWKDAIFTSPKTFILNDGTA